MTAHRYYSDGMRYRAVRFVVMNDEHPAIDSFEFSQPFDDKVSQDVMDREIDRLIDHLLDAGVAL